MKLHDSQPESVTASNSGGICVGQITSPLHFVRLLSSSETSELGSDKEKTGPGDSSHPVSLARVTLSHWVERAGGAFG